MSPTAFDFATPIIHSQLTVINTTFNLNLVALHDDYKYAKNKEKRKWYHAAFDGNERSCIKRKWKEMMHNLQKHILFFDFVENHHISKNSLNMV